MIKFIESICFKNGAYLNLELHQERMDNTCFNFFGETLHKLEEFLPQVSFVGKHKVRVLYDNVEHSCQHIPYQKKQVNSLKLVNSEWFDYSFKYEDRETINELLATSGADEIIISIDNKITDSSYSNLAFWDGREWFTPESPLLSGIKRKRLIRENRIKPVSIKCSDLGDFTKVSFINSMLDLGELELPVSAILSS